MNLASKQDLELHHHMHLGLVRKLKDSRSRKGKHNEAI
jgi:hypothetical protein